MSTTAPSPSSASPSSSPSPSMTAVVATRIFINQLPDYVLLSSCAEEQISTIVRDMKWGCGDGSRTTSFACFCSTSSTHFDSLIGAYVRTACPSDAGEETKARNLFSEYCEIPITAGFSGGLIPVKTTSGGLTSSPSTLQSSTTVSARISSLESQVGTSSSSPAPSVQPIANTGVPRSTVIALSVTLPLLALFLAIGIFLARPHKTKTKKNKSTTTKEAEELESKTKQGQETAGTVEIYTNPTELPEREKAPYHAVELPVNQKGLSGIAELEGGRF